MNASVMVVVPVPRRTWRSWRRSERRHLQALIGLFVDHVEREVVVLEHSAVRTERIRLLADLHHEVAGPGDIAASDHGDSHLVNGLQHRHIGCQRDRCRDELPETQECRNRFKRPLGAAEAVAG